MGPLVHVRTRKVDPALSASLRPQFEQAVGRHLLTRAVLGELDRVFGTHVRWVVLKGPVLSELAHPVPCARPYGDLDVLIDPSQLREAVELLVQQRWVLLDRNHPLLSKRIPGELHLLSPSGVQVDLHWSVLNMAHTRAAFPVQTRELLRRTRLVPIGSHATPTLEVEEFFVHVCLHAALSGADRLLLLLDVDQLARDTRVDWDRLVSAVGRWGAGPAVAVSLGRAHRLLGAPVPSTLLSSLCGTPWRTLTSIVDRLAPVHLSPEGGSVGRLVARASRPDDARSWGQLTHRVRARLVVGEATYESLAVDHPDADALEGYFDAVGRAASQVGDGIPESGHR